MGKICKCGRPLEENENKCPYCRLKDKENTMSKMRVVGGILGGGSILGLTMKKHMKSINNIIRKKR